MFSTSGCTIISKAKNQQFFKFWFQKSSANSANSLNCTFLWILKHCTAEERERPTACVWWCQAVSKINVSSSREINRYHSSHQMIFPTLICPHWIPVERNHIFTYMQSDQEKNDIHVIGKAYSNCLLPSDLSQNSSRNFSFWWLYQVKSYMGVFE